MTDHTIRVLCIGSPFGGDAVGLAVAPLFESRLDSARVMVSAHDRPGADLVHLMRGADAVVLVDAVKTGAEPGTLVRLEWRQMRATLARHTSTHGFGLADALELAEKLGELPPTLVLWGVEPGEAVKPESLAEAVAGEVADLLEKLNQSSQRTR